MSVAFLTAPLPGREATFADAVGNYLCALAENVRWPDGATAERREFRIGVLGPSSLDAGFERFVEGKKLKNQPIRIVRSGEAGDLAGCDLLYVERPTVAQMAELTGLLDGKPVLTVIFSPESTVVGACIQLHLLRDGRLRCSLDMRLLREARLTPSPGLLQIALREPPK